MNDVQVWRDEFPVTRQWAYLDLANKCPLPRAVVEAWHSFLREGHEGEGIKDTWKAEAEVVRGKVAALLEASPEEIAFTKNTSEGLNILANAIPFAAGENVVVHAREHPNNLYPWLHVARKGVEVRVVNSSNGDIGLEDLVGRMDTCTRVVAVSWVSYCTGRRMNLWALGQHCRAHGALLVVDGIQAIGIVDTPVRRLGIDALACGAHKGLLSTHGVGFLYCRQELLESLRPAYAARASLVSASADSRALSFASDARRFEIGNANYGGLHALEAALDLIARIGVSRIEKRVHHLVGTLMDLLDRKGIPFVTPRAAEERAGIVAFQVPRPHEVQAALKRHRVVVSVIEGLLRAAPHFYNTEEELDHFARLL
ncbi:MAG: aminotransferase class V-fold PLP-dependent enzyme [Candidatus Rokubacteria bacterium]|nr:aminotransferase class V-fold PLP-dependent enzyme [Candidatus Rokubacteria bacterium]